MFPAADQVGKLTVFNVGGNKVRVIAAIHYNRKRIYIRAVLTREEYNRGVLFLTFPEMKTELGAVSNALQALGATAGEMKTWRELVAQELSAPNDDDEFN